MVEPRLRSLQDLPHPPRLPIVGNGHQLTPSKLHLTLEKWADEYGCPYAADIVSSKFVSFDDPDIVDEVHRARPARFSRYHKIEPLTKELQAYGVFSAEGQEWRVQRRLAMAALAQKNLRGFYGTLRKVALRLRERFRAAAEEGTVLDLLSEVMLFTVDVTSSLAFGRDTNTIEHEQDRIQEHLALIFPMLQKRLIAVYPYWRKVRLPADRRLDRALLVLGRWIGELISETRAELKARPELADRPENLLQAMLSSQSERGEPFSEAQIHGNVMTMLLAGEETTAGTIAWAVHELLESPPALEAVRAEVDRVLALESIPEDPARCDALDYLLAVANETLRLRPAVPATTMTALEDCVLGGVEVPRGTNVNLLLRRISVNPAYVTEGGRFWPERWLDPERAGELRRRGIFVPFGSGPRLCPGRALGLLELRVVLGMLFREFEVTRVGEAREVTEELQFTMAPRGLRVRLERRRAV